MKILFICHRMPFPPNRGGKIRPFNMIQHLSQKHTVVVASLAESEQELHDGAGLRQYCTQVIAEVLPIPIRWRQACRALYTSIPSSVAYFWSSRLHRRIQQALIETKFDVVFVHCAFVAQYVTDMHPGCRILDFGDIDSAKWFAYSQYRFFPLSLGYRLEAKKLRQYEIKIAKRFHHCTVTTQGEGDEYQTLAVPAPYTVIPNGVDSTFFSRSLPYPPQNSSVIVFLGRMNYFPNVDGILHFVEKILPIIRQSVPAAELRIIGSNPTRKISNLANVPGIAVTGPVSDVRPHLLDAAVSIAPLRIARGTQNKILESMAMGIPIVATPEAAKGIQAIPGEHLLIGHRPEDFANQVIKIMKSVKLRQRLSESGRRQVENAHAWPLSMYLLDTVLASSRLNNRIRKSSIA